MLLSFLATYGITPPSVDSLPTTTRYFEHESTFLKIPRYGELTSLEMDTLNKIAGFEERVALTLNAILSDIKAVYPDIKENNSKLVSDVYSALMNRARLKVYSGKVVSFDPEQPFVKEIRGFLEERELDFSKDIDEDLLIKETNSFEFRILCFEKQEQLIEAGVTGASLYDKVKNVINGENWVKDSNIKSYDISGVAGQYPDIYNLLEIYGLLCDRDAFQLEFLAIMRGACLSMPPLLSSAQKYFFESVQGEFPKKQEVNTNDQNVEEKSPDDSSSVKKKKSTPAE